MLPPKTEKSAQNTPPNASDRQPKSYSLTHHQLLVTYSPLLTMLGVFAIFTGIFYTILYLRTGIQQNLWAEIPIVITVIIIPFAYRLARQGAAIRAGILTMIGFCIVYEVNELLWIGLTPYHIVGGVLLILLTGNLILQRERWVWLSTIGIYSIFIILANNIHLITRYNVAELPLLLPYTIGTNILLVLALTALIIRSIRTRTIRTRLLVNFILLVLAPVILSATISSILSARNTQEHVYNQLDSVVTLKEDEINAWVNHLQTYLMLAMPVPDRTWVFSTSMNRTGSQGTDEQFSVLAANITTDLDKFIAQTQDFDALFLLNPNGKIFISTNKSLLNMEQADETYFKEGLNDSYISPIQQISLLGVGNKTVADNSRTTLILSTPVFNSNGDTIGVLAGQANFTKLNEIMFERSGLGKNGETFLLNPNLVLLTDSRFEGYTAGENYRVDEAIHQALVNKDKGQAVYRSYRGATVIGAYSWLPSLQILLVAEHDQPEALISTYQTLVINLGVVAAAALAALGAGWYAARGITDPLSKLAQTAEAIAAGDVTLNAEVEQDDEVGALAKSFNSMTDQIRSLLQGLEQRVTERTREVERRSLQLQVAAEVAREAAETRDLTELLNRAVHLIGEYFGYYHAGIYLIDERGDYAVLRAATGEAGQQMLRDGYKLEVIKSDYKTVQRTPENQGLVGYVSWSGVARIVSDVETDLIYSKNPLLPGTRSEVALPLRVGNQVIGVLDSQSTDEGVFTDENVRILQTMADLLAIAIENARLFQEMNQTVRELETIYGQYTREAWIGLKNRGKEANIEAISDYRYRGLAIEKAEQPNAEVNEALNTGCTVVKVEQPHAALAIPLQLRGQTVGVVNLRFEGQALSMETVSTYQEIANRLVLVLENARLLQEAQQLARREQQINVISTKIRSSSTTDSILRNTVRELGNALGASRTFIQLGIQVDSSGKDNQPLNTRQDQPGTPQQPSDQVSVKNTGDQMEPRE